MTTSTAFELARSLMDLHGLRSWVVQFDNAKRRAGYCDYTHKVISLSRHYVENNTFAHIRDTILHEIAHALVDPWVAAHGPEWKAMCIKIGAVPEACYKTSERVMPKKTWKAQCPGCQKVFLRDRRKYKKMWCTRCGPERGVITFERNV